MLPSSLLGSQAVHAAIVVTLTRLCADCLRDVHEPAGNVLPNVRQLVDHRAVVDIARRVDDVPGRVSPSGPSHQRVLIESHPVPGNGVTEHALGDVDLLTRHAALPRLENLE